MKKWIESDLITKTINDYNDNMEEIEQGFDNRYTKQEVDISLDLKANKQQEEWITPTLLNGWTEFDVPRTPKYFKDTLGMVHLKGVVKSGTETIYFLPPGYRPSSTVNIATVSNSTFGYIQITTAGVVTMQVGSNDWVSLENITFKAVV